MAAEEARKEEVKNEAKEEEAKKEQVKDDAKEEEAKKEQVKGEAKQEEAKKQEEVEIELVSDTTAFKLSKECATETFYGSGDNIPPSLLEKKKRQYAKWKQVQIEKGKILKKGKWSKQLDSIDETTKATKKDTTEIKATTKDIQIKTDQLLDEQKALPEKLFEAIDKKNKAVYGKPRDQVDMALHLASQQVPVKVLNAILSDCGTNMKGSKMDKAKWIADKAKEKPEEITALLEKHATSEPPAKRQRRVSDWARKAGGDIDEERELADKRRLQNIAACPELHDGFEDIEFPDEAKEVKKAEKQKEKETKAAEKEKEKEVKKAEKQKEKETKAAEKEKEKEVNAAEKEEQMKEAKLAADAKQAELQEAKLAVKAKEQEAKEAKLAAKATKGKGKGRGKGKGKGKAEVNPDVDSVVQSP